MKSLALICLSLALWAQAYAGERRASQVNANGETTVSALSGKTKLVAVFQTSTVDISTGDKTPRFAQCTYGRIPCVLTGKMKIFVNGSEILVSRSTYADLGDIASAEFSAKKGLFALTIEGGDASESYIARIVFNKKRLLQRRMYYGGDPYHVTEVTHYYETPGLD